MLDLLVFMFTQLGNFIMFFDDITIFNSFSLLKLFIIAIIFKIVIKFIGSRGHDEWFCTFY